jgi:C4-dicarboxylate-specific signal transduction histidine kinase
MKSKEMNVLRGQIEHRFREQVALQTAATIAHDLNQPLTAITYYADAAINMLKTDRMQSQKFAQILEKCSQQAHRAGNVFRQLTELLSKAETISEPIDINHSIQEAYNLVTAHEQLNSFEIKLELAERLPMVLANRFQILKVLTRLIDNGIEAMQEANLLAGLLMITSQRVAGNPDMAQVTVRDHGKGVPDPSDLIKIFQPFYSTKPSGLGLGLAISRALIEANGGKLWVEQNKDAGLSFHFTLPFVS